MASPTLDWKTSPPRPTRFTSGTDRSTRWWRPLPATITRDRPARVTQTVTAKLQQGVSVKDFGAVGDGAHMAADTAGIKAAVAAQRPFQAKQSMFRPETICWITVAAAVLSGAQNVLIYGDGPSSSLACQTIGTNDCIASTGRHRVRAYRTWLFPSGRRLPPGHQAMRWMFNPAPIALSMGSRLTMVTSAGSGWQARCTTPSIT